MGNILLAIGCDSYLRLDQLTGAENDASRMYELLIGDGDYNHSESDSVLLKSPTLTELQSSLCGLDIRKADTFTLYFAGHGAIKAGSFWLCLKDTDYEKISSTGYSLSSLLQFIQENQPGHTNIIIDACHSGGIIGDVRAALRSHDFGDEASVGISFLAACAKNQYASEINGEGVCTAAIAKCITGDALIHDLSPELDLAAIARSISQINLGDQSPIFWGLNLSGAAYLCPNPHYTHEGSLRKFISNRSSRKISSEVRRSLWKAYLEIEGEWNCSKFQKSITAFLEQQDFDVQNRLAVLRQVSSAFVLESTAASDPFREIEVQSSFLTNLLPLCEDPLVAAYVAEQCASIRNKVGAAIDTAASLIDKNKYALLGRSAHSELFHLPIRISRLAGWAGFALDGELNSLSAIEKFFGQIFEHYALSCSTMSDVQAPYVASAICGLKKAGLNSAAEMFSGLLFKSLCDVRGNIAAWRSESREVISYLFMRALNNFGEAEGIVSRPSELAMVLLLGADKLGLGDIFDSSMEDLDRVSINAFIPRSYKDFYLPRIEDGQNVTFKIGFDIWSTKDLVTHWNSALKPVPQNAAVRQLSLLCSLLYPDRVAWHLFD